MTQKREIEKLSWILSKIVDRELGKGDSGAMYAYVYKKAKQKKKGQFCNFTFLKSNSSKMSCQPKRIWNWIPCPANQNIPTNQTPAYFS